MDSFMNNFSSLIITVLVSLFIIFFLFKKFVKMALFFTLILLAIGGYFYLKDPQKMSESVKQTAEKVKKIEPGKLIETGKNAYRDSKELLEKGKKLPGQIDRLVTGKELLKGTGPDGGTTARN